MTNLGPDQWRRLEELFSEATAMPPDRLDAWLDEQSRADAILVQHLRELLAHDRGARDHVAGVVREAAEAAAHPIDWTGKRFGVYRITREIGRGGMGLVFEAFRDDAEVQQRVALKIAPWWRADLLGERFRAERQILAGLEHPNIARFLDAGSEDNIPYFVMEFVDGRPITDYARERKLRERITLFRSACAAVQYAHERLVVHRDLKPANILVTERGEAKLLDFGIAKVLGDGKAGDGTITAAAPWTPGYASPEQARGERITTRTDVYSLGLVLFEMLTGERAQAADTSSPLAMHRSICETEIPPASLKAPRALARQLTGDLDTITAKAVHKDPERRYHSVSEFSADLGRYLEGLPVLARKESPLYRASRFVRRHWIPVTAGAVTAIGLLAGAAGFAWQARIAQRRFDQVRKLATVFLFDVHDKVEALPGSTGVRDMITRVAVESLDNLSRDAGSNYPLRRELAAGYLRLGMVQGGMTGSHLGRHSEALASFEHGLALLDRMPAPELRHAVATEASLRSNRGHILGALGEASRAETDLKRALELENELCTDPVRDKAACIDKVTTIAALIQITVKHRQAASVAAYHQQFDAMTEMLRPVLSPVDYQAAHFKSKMQEARLAYLSGGGELALVKVLRPGLASMIELVEANPRVEMLRMGVNYTGFLSGSLLHDGGNGRPDPELESALKHAVSWTDRLKQLDPEDQRSRSQNAEMKGELGAVMALRDPAAGVGLLRQALADYVDLIRATPQNMDEIALMVDETDLYIRAEIQLGREDQAAQTIAPVLDLYDPSMMIGMRLPRSAGTKSTQALAWIAGQRRYAKRHPNAKWANQATAAANTALRDHPNDAALEASAAQLFDALGDTERARVLWQAVSALFPENPTLTSRAAGK